MFQKYRTLISLLVASVLPSACSGPVEEARQSRVIPWWIWLLVIVVALAVFIWLWLTSPKEEEVPTAEPEATVPTAQLEAAAPSHVVETPAGVARRPAVVMEAPKPDDLKDPTTWPEQASLAAAGKWDELEALQRELKGGRRV